MDRNIERGTWLKRISSSYDEGKFRTAMAMACSFLQVEEIYPDQDKAHTGFLKEVIFLQLAHNLFQTHHQT